MDGGRAAAAGEGVSGMKPMRNDPNAECGMRIVECTGVCRGASDLPLQLRIPHWNRSAFDLMPDDLAEVYRTTYRALVRFLYRRVWDAERAEDLAQEAFARALVHKPENARGWLFVVAANMARDEARKAARERRHLTLLKSEPDAVHGAPEDEIDADTQRARVRLALEQLTPRDREALLLWDAGMSYDQIATQTGLARGAIGTTLARARRRLVEAYESRSEGQNVAR